MQKNDLVTVAIEDIGVGGEGIGKVDGYTLFIKDAIIGDVVEAKIVKAKKNYGYARLMNIVTPSENRVEKPACPMARRCGGCQIQEMKYGAQLAFKEGKVRGNLERIGEVPTELLDQIMHPAVGMTKLCSLLLAWKSHFIIEIKRSSQLEQTKKDTSSLDFTQEEPTASFRIQTVHWA